MKIVTSFEIREIDKRAQELYGIADSLLMENAGRESAKSIMAHFSGEVGHGVAIFCGKGNNGGDGFVVARYLMKEGVDVDVFLLVREEELKGIALENFILLKKIGCPINALHGEMNEEEDYGWKEIVSRKGVIVDAIFGTGFKGSPPPFVEEIIEYINSSNKKICSIDVPSGVNSTTGVVHGKAIRADLTVTFGLPKIGLFTGDGVDRTGRVEIKDIGYPQILIDNSDLKGSLLTDEDVAPLFPKRNRSSHKGNFGHLAIISGGPGKRGAAVLASMAAIRSGAGLVTLIVPSSIVDFLPSIGSEIMVEGLPCSAEGYFSLESINHLFSLLKGKDAVAIGPGISTNPSTIDFMDEFLKTLSLPVLLDADALNIIGILKREGRLNLPPTPMIFTPHPGEMSRLTGKGIRDIQSDRVGESIHFAKETGAVIVLKGAGTVIASPDGRFWICPLGNPGMASGGVGDVLTGVVGALLSAGNDAEVSAFAGVYIHALAGDMVCDERGEYGMIASDIIDKIPEAIRKVQRFNLTGNDARS